MSKGRERHGCLSTSGRLVTHYQSSGDRHTMCRSGYDHCRASTYIPVALLESVSLTLSSSQPLISEETLVDYLPSVHFGRSRRRGDMIEVRERHGCLFLAD